jgi:peptide/nickel transport system permease protein
MQNPLSGYQKVNKRELKRRKAAYKAQAARKSDEIYVASQFKLTRMRFMRNKLAVVGFVTLLVIYFIAIFAGFLAPYGKQDYNPKIANMKPMGIHFVDSQGNFSLRPFVYEIVAGYDPVTFLPMYEENTESKQYVKLFTRGTPYEILWLFKTDIHLFGVEEAAGPTGGVYGIHFFGTDQAGRDLFSRTLIGAQISSTVGLIGVMLSFVLGLILGGLSGYLGGAVDTVIQRVIDFTISLPTIPLWLALAAAVPSNWPVTKTYFMITVILSLVSWPGLARTVRSKFISLKNEDFVRAARVAGASTGRIIRKHMIPMFTSHLIASLSLSIPGMILGETSLSFLGLGLRAPAVSWGVLLADAQKFRNVSLYPWTLIPGIFIIVTVMAFNFVGDGLRDAADPYL